MRTAQPRRPADLRGDLLLQRRVGKPPTMTPGSSMPWKAAMWTDRRGITELSSGKLVGSISADVMGQRVRRPSCR
jgi:hypothetical protein